MGKSIDTATSFCSEYEKENEVGLNPNRLLRDRLIEIVTETEWYKRKRNELSKEALAEVNERKEALAIELELIKIQMKDNMLKQRERGGQK